MWNGVVRRFVAAGLIATLMAVLSPEPVSSADKILERVSGTVGHAATPEGFQPLAATLALNDNEYAITRDKSIALLSMPDSSQVTIGANSVVQVGAFNTSAADGDGATITVNRGTLRFKIQRPPGRKSNYKFVGLTSTTGVRGTTAAIVADPQQGDTIACIDCAPGDVVVTLKDNSRSFTLISGQVLRISLTGVIIGATIAAVAAQFAGAGVSMSATSATGAAGAAGAGGGAAGGGAAGGAASGAAAGAAAGVSTAVVAGVAVAAAAAVAVSQSNNATPIPTQTGTITLGGVQRHPVAIKPSPSPSPSPSPAPRGGKH